jgi:hypothetical protein
MNKQGQFTQIQKIGIGSLIGIFGFIIMSFGASLNNVWFIRGGIVAVTFASWLISWK